MPEGALNFAADPVPSAEPEEEGPAPATVATVEVESCKDRMALFDQSAMNNSVPSPQIPDGKQNSAFDPMPSTKPQSPSPPIVETIPVAKEIMRILLLPASATYRLVPLPQIP